MPIALYAYVEIDNVTFNSNDVRSYNVSSEDEQVDGSGFNSNGLDNMLAGKRARSITIEFFTKRTTGAMAQVIFPLHDAKSAFEIAVRDNMNAAVSLTNPEWRGLVTLPIWAEGAARGEVETTSLTFISSGVTGLQRYYT